MCFIFDYSIVIQYMFRQGTIRFFCYSAIYAYIPHFHATVGGYSMCFIFSIFARSLARACVQTSGRGTESLSSFLAWASTTPRWRRAPVRATSTCRYCIGIVRLRTYEWWCGAVRLVWFLTEYKEIECKCVGC